MCLFFFFRLDLIFSTELNHLLYREYEESFQGIKRENRAQNKGFYFWRELPRSDREEMDVGRRVI